MPRGYLQYIVQLHITLTIISFFFSINDWDKPVHHCSVYPSVFKRIRIFKRIRSIGGGLLHGLKVAGDTCHE